ncbi:hypothetical protein ACFLUG_04380 [Chloroflexota bacterium]
MNNLKECYKRLYNILKEDNSFPIEPFESVDLVEEYRRFWKPNKTKVVLLAESHVLTRQKDMNITLPDIEELPGYPKKYAKFVYCLGYGEPELTKNDSHPKLDGTWQFWKIFYSCINTIQDNSDFKRILKGERGAHFKERLSNKINLLQNLKRDGIWLIDASITALYDASKKPKKTTYREIIKTSWNSYTKDVIAEANPMHIICIGKGVYNVLGNELKRFNNSRIHLIEQPNAHLSAQRHLMNYQKYGEVCRYG